MLKNGSFPCSEDVLAGGNLKKTPSLPRVPAPHAEKKNKDGSVLGSHCKLISYWSLLEGRSGGLPKELNIEIGGAVLSELLKIKAP
jgi:hypothetical protein